MKDTFSYDDLVQAQKLVDDIPIERFRGYKIICNPMLEPNEVVIMVGSEYMHKLKKLEYEQSGYRPFRTDMV